MRNEDEYDPKFTNMSEQYVDDHVAGFGVEHTDWLVANQRIGIAHQRSGDGGRYYSPPDRHDGISHTVRLPSPVVRNMRKTRLLMAHRGMPP